MTLCCRPVPNCLPLWSTAVGLPAGSHCLQVAGLPRTITPPEVLSLFWGWQVRPASTYILAPAHESPHVEVRFAWLAPSQPLGRVHLFLVQSMTASSV